MGKPGRGLRAWSYSVHQEAPCVVSPKSTATFLVRIIGALSEHGLIGVVLFVLVIAVFAIGHAVTIILLQEVNEHIKAHRERTNLEVIELARAATHNEDLLDRTLIELDRTQRALSENKSHLDQLTMLHRALAEKISMMMLLGLQQRDRAQQPAASRPPQRIPRHHSE